MPGEYYFLENNKNIRIIFEGATDYNKYITLARALLADKIGMQHGAKHSDWLRMEDDNKHINVEQRYDPMEKYNDYMNKSKLQNVMKRNREARSLVRVLNGHLKNHSKKVTIIPMRKGKKIFSATKKYQWGAADAYLMEYDLKKYQARYPIAANGPVVIVTDRPDAYSTIYNIMHELGHALQRYHGPDRWLFCHREANKRAQRAGNIEDALLAKLVMEQDNVDRHENPIRVSIGSDGKAVMPKIKLRKWYNDSTERILLKGVRSKKVKWHKGYPWHKDAFNLLMGPFFDSDKAWGKLGSSVLWVRSPAINYYAGRTDAPLYTTSIPGKTQNKWLRTSRRKTTKKPPRPITQSHLKEICDATDDFLNVVDIPSSARRRIKLVHNRNYFSLPKDKFALKVNELKARMPRQDGGLVAPDTATKLSGFCGDDTVLYNQRRWGEDARESNVYSGWYIPTGPNYGQQLHATIHESMHLHSKDCRGFNYHPRVTTDNFQEYEFLDEGFTELFTRVICRHLTYSPGFTAKPEMVLNGYTRGQNEWGFLPVYEGLVQLALIICHLIGVKSVAKAYFIGDFHQYDEKIKNLPKKSLQLLKEQLPKLAKDNCNYVKPTPEPSLAHGALIKLSTLTPNHKLGVRCLKPRAELTRQNKYYNGSLVHLRVK